VSNGKDPVEKVAQEVIARDTARRAGRPGKAQPSTVSRIPKWWVVPATIAVVVIATGICTLGGRTPTGSGPSTSPGAAVTGGSGLHTDYFLEGVIVSRSGCQGTFYDSAPKVGAYHNLLEQMWLSGGVLHSTNGGGYSPDYTGTLHVAGSFQLVWTVATPSGDKGRVDGQISPDGQHITGTWDWVFTDGCVNHMKITEGHFLSGGSIARFPDAPH
jgi:hypothetical protein